MEREYDLSDLGIDDGPVQEAPEPVVEAPEVEPVIELPGTVVEQDVSVESATMDDVDIESLSPRERAYLARIEELQQRVIEAPPSSPGTTEQPVTPSPQTELDFVAGVNLDEVFADGPSFNKFLNTFYQKTLEQARSLAAEQIMSTLPGTITNYISQHMAMKGMVDEFYTKNPDLAQVKRTLAGVANEVSAEKPELQLAQVFEEAGTRVRKMLGLKAKASGSPTLAPKTKPSLLRPKGSAPRGGTTEPEVDENSLESRVADLLAL